MTREDGRWAVHLRATEAGAGVDTVRARVVIGADGVETMVGRWAGLDTRVPARDMESCAQYLIQGIACDPDAISSRSAARSRPAGMPGSSPRGPASRTSASASSPCGPTGAPPGSTWMRG
jgi:flavin-dependent dehydrogenase